jgi:plastocyanin
MKGSAVKKIFVLVAVIAMLSAGCGNKSNTSSSGDSGSGSANEVDAYDFRFEPTTLSFDPGQDVTLTFKNEGKVSHSFTSDDLGVDEVAEAGSDMQISFTVPDSATTIEWHCKFHPDQMHGTISVGGATGAGGSSSNSDPSQSDGGYNY